MDFKDKKEWLHNNGALELFDHIPNGGGTTGMWVGYNGLLFTSCAEDPVDEIYYIIEHKLWSVINETT